MPRARNIKPGFFVNEHLVQLPFETRLLFIGLWTLADREGRLEDRPLKIKMSVFPADDVNVERGLQELHESGMVQRYTVDNQRFIQVVNFAKHQNPHQNEKGLDLPPPPALEDSGASTRVVEESTEAIGLIPSSLNPESLSTDYSSSEEKCANAHSSADAEAVQEVFTYWQEKLNYPQRKLNADRRNKIKARLRSFSTSDLKKAIDGASQDAFLNGDNPRSKKYTDIGTIFKNDSKVEELMEAVATQRPGYDPKLLARERVDFFEREIVNEYRAYPIEYCQSELARYKEML